MFVLSQGFAVQSNKSDYKYDKGISFQLNFGLTVFTKLFPPGLHFEI